MKEISAQLFFMTAILVAGQATLLELDVREDLEEEEEQRKRTLQILEKVLNRCKEMGLDFTAMYAERMVADLPRNYSRKWAARALSEIQIHIEHETSKAIFLQIPRDHAAYYKKSELFGPEVAAKFPSTISDVEEAGNCFATGRYTACVFHLMRVMEIGVQEFGIKLQTPNPTEKLWQTILNDVNVAIRQMSQPSTPMTAQQKADRDEYSQAAVYLENVKNAWRNNVMHPKATYTEDEAEEVLRTVKVYMQYLAKIL